MGDSTLEKTLAAEFDKASSQLLQHSPTVLILGQTGVGKSTLINSLFGISVAAVSNGAPCTQGFVYYPATAQCTVHLYDSKGLEPLDQGFRSQLKEFIKQQHKSMSNDITKGVHCAWYVLNAATPRWTQGDTSIVRAILCGIPTIIVLNKCDLATSMQIASVSNSITSCNIPNVKGIVSISARPDTYRQPACPQHRDNDLNIRTRTRTWMCNECDVGGELDFAPRGLGELLDLTVLQMPEIVRMSFLAAQGSRLESKMIAARGVVICSSLAAYVVGWSPIPLSDAPILVAIQMGMAGSLAAIFGILGSVILPIILGQLATFGLGFGAASLIKLIPGVGTLVGGIIDSSVAFVFTLSVGIFYTSLFALVYKKASKATAEERSAIFLKLLASLDVKNILFKIKDLFSGIPHDKAGLERALPAINQQVESMIVNELNRIDLTRQ
jgi:uncharacterized protein (DUF697 family)/GTP-binding protein EngB required for normal cell division